MNYFVYPCEGKHEDSWANGERFESVVVHLTDPINDIGSVSELIASQLYTLDLSPVADINVDGLVDYRAQRPRVHYLNGALEDIAIPALGLFHAKDIEGTSFLLLLGTEPDFCWQGLNSELMAVFAQLGVKRLYRAGSVAGALPHTRQPDMLIRTRNADPVAPALEADVWYPASFSDFLEYSLGQMGVATFSVTVRVPMYIAGHHYAAGAASALSMLAKTAGLSLPLGDLEASAAEESEQLAQLTEHNEQLAEIVAALEHEYDRAEGHPGLIQAPQHTLTVPSADEIGRAAESFLARVDASMVKRKEHADNEQAQLTERLENMRAAWQHASNGHQPGSEAHTGGEAQAGAEAQTEGETRSGAERDAHGEDGGEQAPQRPRGRHAAD
ncbi:MULTISPECIES: PAC2 family protein [Actinotignum]|uniref:PAC2 family protein n=2 Tax=Actinotignum timonense TaxID=1870995 RepID=A0AAW9HJH2_9ACTO|nr:MULTISPECIES: PAC2 family protein [Actinotignum]MBS5749423.1 PAC2 family protein [Actinotignum schaalii]MDE1557715.1 PAC2 family protein [Actinotignum schaalii]MDE1662916.1 PAC2 family protein [Actinotignum schaalii]MDK6372680.1 PAC2 family protein [Actinotignum timonense]MDK6418288.1 PAC2 family protein [Actinotignum timonense]